MTKKIVKLEKKLNATQNAAETFMRVGDMLKNSLSDTKEITNLVKKVKKQLLKHETKMGKLKLKIEKLRG